MELVKKNFALLLAAALCLSLAACGGSDEPVEEEWRGSDDIVAGGIITRSTGSVSVLITVDETGASFYLDEPKQVLFDSVSFPMTISDAQEHFEGIFFDDIDGDGESDVSLGFVYAPGDSISLIWIWDPEKGYVFREDLSVLTTNSGDVSQYVGLWEYADEDVWIRINGDETWEAIDADGNVFRSGTLTVDLTGITFFREDTGETLKLERTVSGDLIDSESGGLIVPTDSIPSNDGGGTGGPDDPGDPADLSAYEGLWLSEVIDRYDYLQFDAKGNWELSSGSQMYDEGRLRYAPKEDATYIDSTQDGPLEGARIELNGDRLYIDACGYFNYLDGRGGQWQGDGGSNWDNENRGDTEVHHRDISAFEGVWYYDNNPSAMTFIEIDSHGNWRYFQRMSDGSETAMIDYGTLNYTADESDAYYAESVMFGGAWTRVYDQGDGVILWNGDAFYWLEW